MANKTTPMENEKIILQRMARPPPRLSMEKPDIVAPHANPGKSISHNRTGLKKIAMVDGNNYVN